MSQPTDNTRVILLGGEERHLKLDLNALATFEKLSGKRYDAIDEDMSMFDLRALLYSLLIHENPDLTQNEVGSWIDMDNIGEVGEALRGVTAGEKASAEGNPSPNRPSRRAAKTG